MILDRRLIIYSVIIVSLYLQGREQMFAAQGTGQGGDATLNARLAIDEAGTATLTNIYQQIVNLRPQFGCLDEIDKAKITHAEPYDKITRRLYRIHHRLEYRKNVRIEQRGPDANGFVTASGERRIIEPGGIELEICIVDRPTKMTTTRTYPLPMGRGDNQVRLIYHLEENPKDPALEKAIQDIIEKNDGLLSKALQDVQIKHPDLPSAESW